MHLAHLRLRDFRNYARLEADFSPGFHVLIGANAQGKTNVLEAIYLMATLRSFRGAGGAQMVRHGQRGYFVGGKVIGQGAHDLKLYWSPVERKLSLNGTTVRRLSEFLGVLRAVVFCTEDLLLVKGTARVRRRLMDLLLAHTQPAYLATLQAYTRTLRSRNVLLKQHSVDESALESFSVRLVDLGSRIVRARHELIPVFQPLASEAYRRIAGGSEVLRLDYQPSVTGDFAVALAKMRNRERQWKTTLIGPHRDDLALKLNDKPAGQFASEGQKRTLAIALKMAQAEYLTLSTGSPPVLLIDDVMGELDASRRAALLPLLDRTHHTHGQVFMTCTEQNWPRELARDLIFWRVNQGTLVPLATPTP